MKTSVDRIYPFQVGDDALLRDYETEESVAVLGVYGITPKHLEFCVKAAPEPLHELGIDLATIWRLECYNYHRGIAVFDGKIERIQAGTPARIFVAHPRDFGKIQRRGYLRVRTTRPILLKSPSGSWSGLTHDLSGGGFGIIIPQMIEADSRWRVSIDVDGHAVEAIARCVRVVMSEEGPLAGFMFEEISESARSRIIQHVYRTEIEEHKRKLGSVT